MHCGKTSFQSVHFNSSDRAQKISFLHDAADIGTRAFGAAHTLARYLAMDSFGSQALLHASVNRSSDSGDPEVEYRVKKVTEKFSECMHIVANEPSLALFRIQEHIRKSLPRLAECKMELGQTQQLVQGAYYDVDYAIRAVSEIQNSTHSFTSIENMLNDSIAQKRQLIAKTQAARAAKARRDSPLTLIKDETGETVNRDSTS